jgi:hypothetical protein
MQDLDVSAAPTGLRCDATIGPAHTLVLHHAGTSKRQVITISMPSRLLHRQWNSCFEGPQRRTQLIALTGIAA